MYRTGTQCLKEAVYWGPKRDSTFTYAGPSEKLYFAHEQIHELLGFVEQSRITWANPSIPIWHNT